MKNKKGFTLIELLAVIVILAIIALIATPLILGVIEDSNKDSLIISAKNIIHAGEIYLAQNIKDNINTNFIYEDDLTKNDLKIKIKNDKITKGRLIVNSDGTSKIVIIKGKYCASNLDSEEVKSYIVGKDSVTNGTDHCEIERIEKPESKETCKFTSTNEQLTGIENADKCDLNNLKIPQTLNNNNLTEIKSSAFNGLGITGEIIIPEGYTKINSSAFADNLIVKVTLPKTLIETIDGSFMNNKIKEVIFQAGPEIIENSQIYSASFSNNPIEKIYFPNASSSPYGDMSYAFDGNIYNEKVIFGK